MITKIYQPEDKDAIDIDKLKAEIELLQLFINKAKQIKQDSKSEALLQALDKSFEMQAKEGASRKALIFTESTKTQAYLKEYLEANGYEGKIVLKIPKFDETGKPVSAVLNK